MSDPHYAYYWAKHPKDGSPYIVCESEGVYFMAAVGEAIPFDPATIICEVEPPPAVKRMMN